MLDHDVLWLDVSVDEAAGMNRRKGPADLLSDLDYFVEREWASLL
jgi:hypothetical protein